MSVIKIFSAIAILLVSAFSYSETLRILNWGDYVDPEVISAFEAEYGELGS